MKNKILFSLIGTLVFVGIGCSSTPETTQPATAETPASDKAAVTAAPATEQPKAEAPKVEKAEKAKPKVAKKAEKKAKGKKIAKQGMEYEVLTPGKADGKSAKAGDQIVVHYEGKLENGNVFDSSKKPGREPFPFQLGVKQVIAGWDVGVEGMKEGERRMLYIPYAMAYGERGMPPAIPPKSNLIFEVELLKVK